MPGPGRLCGVRDSLESRDCGLDPAGHGERSRCCCPRPRFRGDPPGRVSAVVQRRGSGPTRRAAGQCRTHRRVSVSPASPRPPRGSRCGASRERCCCHRYHLSPCLDPKLGERSRRGLRVKLQLSAASVSGQHQPCSPASFIAALGRDVLQPDFFWSALEAGLFVPCPMLKKEKLKL